MTRDSEQEARLHDMVGCAPVIDPTDSSRSGDLTAPLYERIAAKLDRQRRLQAEPRLGDGRSLLLTDAEQRTLDQLDG